MTGNDLSVPSLQGDDDEDIIKSTDEYAVATSWRELEQLIAILDALEFWSEACNEAHG